ncbi:MAG TPA: response regulator [Xanthobacteraceae bacterium]|nr:response regulator [Xanthobacteraceae bacterium]
MDNRYDLTVRIAVVGIVDDDPAVRNSLKFSLEIEGFAVGVYANAEELLTENDLSRFRCLVIDQHLPGLSGLDLVTKLRERRVAVPVILITTHPSRAVAARAEKAAVPIVEKPLLGNALLDEIRSLMASPTPPSAS